MTGVRSERSHRSGVPTSQSRQTDRDPTTWGWVHLIVGIGIGVAVAGFYLFTGAVWARAVGIGVAALSAALNFMWLPYYPIWSLVIIVLDVLVIWALAAHGRDFAR